MSAEQVFMLADKDIRCRDVWQFHVLRHTALLAYKSLEQRGDFVIRYPVMLYPSRAQMVIWYDASIPHEWALETLRAEEVRLEGEAMAERDALEGRMMALVDSMGTDILPDFETAANRYWELQRILGVAV